MSGRSGHVARRLLGRTVFRSPRVTTSFSTSSGLKRKSPHAEWYSQVVPSMLPIALLGSTVYIALQLVQSHLSRERYLDEATARVDALENQLEELRRTTKKTDTTKKETATARWWFSS